MKKEVLLVLTSLLVFQLSFSQDSTSFLTLRDAISSAITNNDAVKISALNEQIAKLELKQTDAIFILYSRGLLSR